MQSFVTSLVDEESDRCADCGHLTKGMRVLIASPTVVTSLVDEGADRSARCGNLFCG